MSPTRISIDLNQSPIRIGGLIIGKYIVSRGSKEVKVNTTDNLKEEVVESFRDATSVVKSFFGAQQFDAAVVVVPNLTPPKRRDDIRSYGHALGFNITQVVEEHAAVVVAYAEKDRPRERTKVAIVSLSSSILNISIISVIPKGDNPVHFIYLLHDHKVSTVPNDSEQHKGGQGFAGGMLGVAADAFKTIVVDPFDTVVNVLKGLVGNLYVGHGGAVNKVVLVGKGVRSDKLLHEVKERFPGSEVWSGIEEVEEVAAYGAAVLSNQDARINLLSEAEYGEGNLGFEV